MAPCPVLECSKRVSREGREKGFCFNALPAPIMAFRKEFFYHQVCDDVDETDGRPQRETGTDAEIREIADEILWEHDFFRFVGNPDALDAESTARLVAEAMFWRPRYVWIKGEVYEA